MSEHTGFISSYQLLITAACTNTGGKMKGSHSRAADRCPFVLRHRLSQVSSSMQLGTLCHFTSIGKNLSTCTCPDTINALTFCSNIVKIQIRSKRNKNPNRPFCFWENLAVLIVECQFIWGFISIKNSQTFLMLYICSAQIV